MKELRQSSALDRVAPFPVLLAPMVGLTHLVVRRAIQEYLPDGRRSLWPTEMLSSRRLPSQRVAGLQIETRFDDAESGLCPQLLANEEGFIRDSIARLRDWGATAIDINMGCPVKRALKHNYGVALMGDPDYAAEIVSLAVKHADGLPVSVKLRAAPPPNELRAESDGTLRTVPTPEPEPEFLLRFCRKLEEAGASWLTLHPRTAAQMRKGRADWAQIGTVKKALSIPLVGNGDVQSVDDIRRMFDQTGCDRVMIGRALLAKPWMLRESQGEARGLGPYEAGAEYGRFLSRILELSREHYEEEAGLRRFRFLAFHGCPYLEFGHALYASFRAAGTYEEVAKALKAFFGERFDRPQRMSETTSIRA